MPEKESYCRLNIAGYRVKPNLTIKEKQKFETKQNKTKQKDCKCDVYSAVTFG